MQEKVNRKGRHKMAKKKNSSMTYHEIYKQPESFEAAYQAFKESYELLEEVWAEPVEEVIFTGCGTSFYLAQSAAFAFSSCSKTSSRAVCCSELYYYPDHYVKGKRVLLIPITRKSVTTEVRRAVERLRIRPGVRTLSITCDDGSHVYNDYVLLSPKARENSVVMTRTFTSMLYLAVLLALYAGGRQKEIEELNGYGEKAEQFLRRADDLAAKILGDRSGLTLFVTLGQGIYYGVANECMNKMKEMGIANSEAYHTLEYRHGPMSLVDGHTLIILFSSEETREEDRRLLKEMKGYGAVTAVVGIDAESDIDAADYRLNLPKEYCDLQNAPMAVMIGQMIGYYLAKEKGLDADSPTHLSQAIVIDMAVPAEASENV